MTWCCVCLHFFRIGNSKIIDRIILPQFYESSYNIIVIRSIIHFCTTKVGQERRQLPSKSHDIWQNVPNDMCRLADTMFILRCYSWNSTLYEELNWMLDNVAQYYYIKGSHRNLFWHKAPRFGVSLNEWELQNVLCYVKYSIKCNFIYYK